jgi:hypothetical protein
VFHRAWAFIALAAFAAAFTAVGLGRARARYGEGSATVAEPRRRWPSRPAFES